jgi:hypothetical protein
VTPEQLREIEFWLDQHTAARNGLDQRTVLAILAMYAGVNFYDRHAVEEVAEAAAETSNTAAILAAGLMSQYLATVTSTVVAEDLPTPAVLLPPLRNGADMRLVYQRPIKLFRRQVAKGTPPAEAYRQAMHAAATLTETNNTLAMRQASQIALSQLATEANITGYRRILRPELAKTGSCGLCIAASDQVYKRADLLPMHGGCNCDVLPIVGAAGGTGDPGNSLNNLDLGDLYAAAGSTDGGDLKRTRFEVNEHGELGPVLTVEGHTFTGPDDLAA